MPLEPVLHSKHLAFASGPLERAIWLIACRFWASGACLDGFDEAAACQIAKINGAHWVRLKSPVMSALADILPELATRHVAAQASRDHMSCVVRENGQKGRLIMWQRHQARKTERDAEKPAPLKTPHKAARYVNEFACMPPHELASIASRPTDTARLLDK